MPVIASVAVEAIGAYQRYVSPHKGYQCAHRIGRAGLSCSEFAKVAILAQGGVWKALPRIKLRLMECRAAYRELQRNSLAQAEQDGSDEKRHPSTKQGDTCVNICTMPCL